MKLFGKKDAGRKKKEKDFSFNAYPHLKDIKPKEKYVFHSDYFMIDSQYAVILGFFHTEGAADNFGPFWGINKIPGGLDDDISILLFEQSRRMTEGWISDHQSRSEGVSQMNASEQDNAGTNTSRNRASKRVMDLETVADELNDGASYLHTQYRLMIKAPTLEKLDKAVAAIDRLYIDRFATLSAAPYIGRQRDELAGLFAANTRKTGRGFYFTSTEIAGSYSLVTHGLEDNTGEYVGYMVGDVNNSAVLFDVDGYEHHIVVADEGYDMSLGRVHIPDVWGSKISQAALLSNHKVVHLVLDGVDLNNLGPKFDGLTYRIDMSHGDVNMFEMFGDIEDELSIFPSQMRKLVLMAEQAYETTDSDRSIIRASLEDIAKKFYIDNRMWVENASRNRSRVRVTGIPHKSVPKLEMFVMYLDSEYKAMKNQKARDDKKLQAISVLDAVFNNLLSNNGDLFNTITSDSIDGAKSGRRVIYDFSGLSLRGIGVAMAQLVNIIGFAVGNLGYGDLVIVHGADLIDNGVKDYIMQQFARLYDKGGRVCYLYNSMPKMLSDKTFCEFDKADYTVFGNMTDTVMNDYQKSLGQDVPADLARLITTKSERRSYIRRGFDNVVFERDLSLCINGGRKFKKKGGSI